ncbi:MAG: DUF362 domain-containing protein [Anaerolineae bacterium]|nr:DUF362 domain-containing protein [Anaerolineae bacterium]
MKYSQLPKFSRREFLLSAVATVALGRYPSRSACAERTMSAQAAMLSNRVIHTHSNEATYWDYATGWYGDYISQTAVDAMTDRGVMALTNTVTLAGAWRALIPGYTAGQKVAIKINLNNASCGSDGQVIDALPQPINAVIRGLKAIGVPENDIWIYDVTNGWHNGEMPSRLMDKVTALYPNVQFHANEPGCSTALGYSTSQKVHFNVPAGKPAISDRPICNALANATYLINMPIMKKHGMAGVTLGFKNHFGSFNRCDLVHWSVDLGDGEYLSTYNGLVDIYNNPHFKNKTVLTVGDGLYGARINNYDEVPSPWPTFGNKSPNSLFFSTDPVAIDCVMYDFLDAESGVPTGSDDYLRLASAIGLGTFEHWDGAHQYHTIDYRRIQVGQTLLRRMYLPLICRDY